MALCGRCRWLPAHGLYCILRGSIFSLFLQPAPSTPRFLPPFRNIFYVTTLPGPCVSSCRKISEKKKIQYIPRRHPPRQADSALLPRSPPEEAAGIRRTLGTREVLANGAIVNERLVHAAEESSCVSGRRWMWGWTWGWTWGPTSRGQEGPVPGVPAVLNSTRGWRRAVTRTLRDSPLAAIRHRRFRTGNDLQVTL